MDRRRLAISSGCLVLASIAAAEPPHASYVFPAGGQRGTSVHVKVGGHFLHDRCSWEILGPGVSAPGELARTGTTWFEGPLIKQPASQQAEDYPQDYAGQIHMAADAPLGLRWWRCWGAQGVTSPLKFVVGELPEVVEEETDGQAIPVAVALPVTINGRIFPREDTDRWSFEAQAGQSITCALVARALGSPLVAQLEVRDAAGSVLADSTGTAQQDAQVRFFAPASGKYEVRIADVAGGGLQHYVYRLTVTAGPWIDHIYPLGGRRGSTVRLETTGQATADGAIDFSVPDVEPGVMEQLVHAAGGTTNAVRFDVGQWPEHLEAEPNDAAEQAPLASAPAVINGRIQSPGDVDWWLVELAKDRPVHMAVRATQLGSPLLAVLMIRDEGGKQLGELDASAVAAGDPALVFTPPADGKYLIELRERFARRSGPQFAYRVVVEPQAVDFRVYVPDSLSVDVGTEKKLEVAVERRGGCKSPITVHVDGLPPGATCDDVQVAPDANKATLTVKCAAGTAVASANLRVVGRGQIEGQAVERVAVSLGQKDGLARGEPIPCRLAITLATPFKFTAQFSFLYAPRGGVLRKRYTIDRGGFDGPLEARLADRQGRHLQGVTGPVVAIPAGASEFDYPLDLPSWMELGRTSRTNLMLTGEVRDAAGSPYKVCFTTREQNEQLIAVVTAAAMRLSLDRRTFAALPGRDLAIPVTIRRDNSVTSPITLSLVVPRHMRGISAEPVDVPAGVDQATLLLKISDAPGPLNMPLTIRAVSRRGDDKITAEEPVELVLLTDSP